MFKRQREVFMQSARAYEVFIHAMPLEPIFMPHSVAVRRRRSAAENSAEEMFLSREAYVEWHMRRRQTWDICLGEFLCCYVTEEFT